MSKKVFLANLGIICALGSSKEEILDQLFQGSLKNVIWREDFSKKFRLATVCDELPAIPKKFKIYNTRCNQLLLAAFLQIKNEVDEMIKKFGKSRVGIVIGSSTSGIDEGQKSLEPFFRARKKSDNFKINILEMGNPSKFLGELLEIDGITYSISTACSSGAKAFVSAKNLIDLDLCDIVLVGGADSLSKLTVIGFDALESLSKDVSNPFSKNRSGITLGEGASLFLMTKEKSDIELAGIGESSDAYHSVSPDPSGKGALLAMQEALKKANLSPKEIDYVNLHGTGTRLNDAMESRAIHNLFKKEILCSSTKPLTGHTLGSSGIIELGICWLLLQNTWNKSLPPQIWDGEFDLDLPKLNFVKLGQKAAKLSACLSNSFAFGGSNASICIKRKN